MRRKDPGYPAVGRLAAAGSFQAVIDSDRRLFRLNFVAREASRRIIAPGIVKSLLDLGFRPGNLNN